MSWVKGLRVQYSKGKRDLEKYRAVIIGDNPDRLTPEQDAELKVVNGMIADMGYAIEWMRTGRRPFSRRGVEIKDAYSRAILMDMDLMPTQPEEQELRFTDRQKQELAKILLRLSARERQCFLLHAVQGLSFAEIGKELKVSKRTVQQSIERAKAKVGQGI